MDDFELELKRAFISEAFLNLEESEGAFIGLEQSANKVADLEMIFRLVHSLKGGSRAAGFQDVAEFTHRLENLVLKIQKDEIHLSTNVITILLRANDRIVEMFNTLKGDITAHFNNGDIYDDFESCISGFPEKSLNPENLIPRVVNQYDSESNNETPSAADFFPALQEETLIELSTGETTTPDEKIESNQKSEVLQSDISSTASRSPNKGKEDEIVRVKLSRIDLLNDYIGELIVLQTVIQQQITKQETQKSFVSLRQLSKLSKEIQYLSMSLRMLPVKPLIQRLHRVVRDTAIALNKQVNFEVRGENLAIDKSVLDQLSDPLLHLLRNAVDHGIETPEGRKASHKQIEGKIQISFLNEGNHLVVEVSDDGPGIDVEKIRAKAVERNLTARSNSLTEKQLIQLIFHPGFSTKSETSEISGRGVGMDVVKTNIEAIGGHVEVSTKSGIGSTFRIQIPLTLAVIEGLIVTAGANRYVIPLSQIQETINLKSFKIHQAKLGIGYCVELRGAVVPLVNLEESLGLKINQQIDSQHTGLVFNINDQLISIVVQDILQAQQVVIKPLSNGIPTQKGWVGSCVLGDGLPALIVSPIDLLQGRVFQKTLGNTVGGAA